MYTNVSLYLYLPDEGSLLPKYRDCTTSNDFELYIYIAQSTISIFRQQATFVRNVQIKRYILDSVIIICIYIYKEFFSENSSSRSNRSMNPFKTASNWTAPPGRNDNLDSYIHKIEKELDVLVHDLNTSKVKLQDNLSSNQRRALYDLKRNNDIVIKPADKGGRFVIMNKDNYMQETCTQLRDGRFYQKLDNDPTPTLTNKLKLLINELQPNLQNDVLKLIPSHPRPATFYTIPKVHKLPNLVVSTCPSSNPDNFIIEAQRRNINPPGRPIVSGIGTLTEYVSAFVDRELQPLLANIPSYIKDTTDFLNKLSRFNNLPDNTILVTLDVTALYSNIPHNDGIGACKKHLDRRALSTTSSEDICQLIKFILENIVFSFNDEYFLQVCGTAMGTRMAPCYANIFMAELEEFFCLAIHTNLSLITDILTTSSLSGLTV